MKILSYLSIFIVARVNGFVPSSRVAILSSSSATTTKKQFDLNLWSPSKKALTETILESKELEPGPFDTKNIIALSVWISLITWAFLFAPGTLGADGDTELLNKLISQPSPRPPDVNELYFAVWNCFAVVPAILAALTAPSGKGQRLPASPFLWASAFFGYFALGPYFSTRTVREDSISKDDLGWASKNIFENRVFGIVLTAVSLSIPFSSDLITPGFDFTTAAGGLSDLFQQSRFVAVSMVDISLMSVLSSILVAEDCKRRGWSDKSLLFLVGTLLFPVVGPSLYLAIRPQSE